MASFPQDFQLPDGQGGSMDTGIYSVAALLELKKGGEENRRLVVGAIKSDSENEAKFEAITELQKAFGLQGVKVSRAIATGFSVRQAYIQRGMPEFKAYAAAGLAYKIDGDVEYADTLESMPILAVSAEDAKRITMRRLRFVCPVFLGWRRFLVSVSPIPISWIDEFHSERRQVKVKIFPIRVDGDDDLFISIENC